MKWIITRDKNIIAKCGDITLKRSSATKLWASLRPYYFKWLREGEGEFILSKEENNERHSRSG